MCKMYYQVSCVWQAGKTQNFTHEIFVNLHHKCGNIFDMAEVTPRKGAENKWYIDVLFVLIILTVCTIATIPQLEAGDYRSHIIWTAELAERHYSHLPHPLYQQITLIIKAIIPYKILNSLTGYAFANNPDLYYIFPGLLTAILSFLATALLIQKRFINYISSDCKYRQVLSWVATSICMIVAPILFFTLNERLIVGYIKPNLWHNPTFNLMKPFAVWTFFFVVDHWKGQLNNNQWIALSLMTSFSILAKPNFILSFLPALSLLLLVQNRSLRRLPWKLLSAIIIPAVLVLLYQYALKYYGNSSQQIVFQPFKAVLAATGNALNIIFFYLLSILFPLLLSIFSKNRIEEKFEFSLVWINFGVAILTAILFVEQPHMNSFNFLWGQNIASFFLFVYSVGWLLRNPGWFKQKKWQTVIIVLVLTLHIIAGITYTLITIISPGPVV